MFLESILSVYLSSRPLDTSSILLAAAQPAPNLLKCAAGSSVDVSRPARTTTQIVFADGLRIPANSDIFVLSKSCNAGQNGSPNFWRYHIRYQGHLRYVSGGFNFI